MAAYADPNNPNPNPTATPDPSTSPPSPAKSNIYGYLGANPTDQQVVQGQVLYGFDNPETAFDSVLRDKGINPYVANPFVQTLRSRVTRPLAQAYLMSRAQTPPSGQWPGGTYPATSPMDYRDFVNQALAGNASGLYGTIRDAATAIPQAIQNVRAYQQAQLNGQVQNVNPFMEALGQQFGANFGQGAAQAQAALFSPMMAQPLASAYRTGVDQTASNALYTMMNNPGTDYLHDDLWKWLYGI